MTPALPTLADTVHSWTYGIRSPIKSPWVQREFEANALDLRMVLRRSNRFTLDDTFVREVVRRASTSQPDKMLALSDLANLPFDSVFIEYSNTMRIKTQKEAGTMRMEREIHDENRGTAGWLIERFNPSVPGHWRATYFTAGDQHSAKDDWFVGPVEYIVNTAGQSLGAGPVLDEIRDGAIAEMTHGMPWGYAVETGDDFVFSATEELSRRGIGLPEGRFLIPLMRYGLETPSKDAKDKLVRVFGNGLFEGRGDLRFLVSLLAMLNTVPTVYHHRTAKGHYRARLRNVPYLDNRLLTIHCGRRHIVNVVDHAFKDALGARHNKRHAVRGFWRDVEYGKALRGCQHEPIERDGDYCLCGKCGHLLKWIDHHERGDATLGWVRHDYNVQV